MKRITNLVLLILFLSLNSISAQISTEGLLAYYPFDGNAMDLSGNNYDGVESAVTYGQDAEGNANAALYLDGSFGYVDISSFGSLFTENLDEMTIYCKVKFEFTGDGQTILSLGMEGENLNTNVFEFELENDQIQIETETGNNAVNHEIELDDKDSLMTNEWHEIMITLKGDKLVYCRDGNVVFDGTYTPTETTSQRLFVGCFACSSINSCCNFNGYIDDLQFYNRIVDKEELMVSLNEVLQEEKVNVYPNPTTDFVNIEMTNEHPFTNYEIINNQGKVLSQSEIVNRTNNLTVDLPYPAGVYLIKLFNTDNSFRIIKVIKD